MAKRLPKKRSAAGTAAAVFNTIRMNAERDVAPKTFCDVGIQTDPPEKVTSVCASDSCDTKWNKCVMLLAHVNAKLDALGAVGSTGCKHEIGIKTIPMDPVRQVSELELLEENSKKDEFVKSVITSIGQLHGRQRYTGKGGSVCLQIVDYFFDRRFLLECSWTGVGRKSAEQEQVLRKVAFSKFDGVIKLFYLTVLQGDPDFTMDECKEFLHRCLRNAKQRFEELGSTRKPAARKRKLREANGQDDSEIEDESEKSTVMYVEEID